LVIANVVFLVQSSHKYISTLLQELLQGSPLLAEVSSTSIQFFRAHQPLTEFLYLCGLLFAVGEITYTFYKVIRKFVSIILWIILIIMVVGGVLVVMNSTGNFEEMKEILVNKVKELTTDLPTQLHVKYEL